MSSIIRSHRELKVYQRGFALAQEIFVLTKRFPIEETYSMTDQIRRSSRSVCANLAEAWRKRRYTKAFIAKLSDVETEAAETQVWAEMAWANEYIPEAEFLRLYDEYEYLIKQVILMVESPEKWVPKR